MELVSIDIELNREEYIMKTSTKLLTSLVLASSLIVSGVMASENGGKGNKSHGFKIERLVKKLSLTDEQSAQVRALVAANKANKPAKPEMTDAEKKAKKEARKAEVLAFFEAPTFDEAAVREKMAKRNAKRIELAISKKSTQHAIYQLLDEEQRVKFLKMLKKKHKKMKKNKHRKNSRES